jgi:FHS family L-fucose permease-like MFS transporter
MNDTSQVHVQPKGGSARVIGLVMALFFAFGFCTVLVDTIIPKLKATFALSYAEVMLTQFCFFGAYFLISLPAAWLHSRIG